MRTTKITPQLPRVVGALIMACIIVAGVVWAVLATSGMTATLPEGYKLQKNDNGHYRFVTPTGYESKAYRSKPTALQAVQRQFRFDRRLSWKDIDD